MRRWFFSKQSLLLSCVPFALAATSDTTRSALTSEQQLALAGQQAERSASAAQTRTFTYPADVGLTLGEGYDVQRDQPTFANCVNTGVVQAPGYYDVDYSVSHAKGKDSLARSLDISYEAEAKATYGGFGGGGKTSMHAFLAQKSTSETEQYVATVRIERGAKFVAGGSSNQDNHYTASFTDDALHLLSSDPLAFRRRCGTGFVVAIISGAEASAVFSFSGLTREERLKLDYASSANVSFGSFLSASGSLKIAASQDAESLRNNVSINVSQRGGGIVAFPANGSSDLDAFKTYLASFTNSANISGKEKPIRFTYLPYSAIAELPEYASETQAKLSKLALWMLRTQDVIDESVAVERALYSDYVVSGKSYVFSSQMVPKYREQVQKVRGEALTTLERLRRAYYLLNKSCSIALSQSQQCANLASRAAIDEELASAPVQEAVWYASMPVPRADVPDGWRPALEVDDDKKLGDILYLTGLLEAEGVARERNLSRCWDHGECLSAADAEAIRMKLRAMYDPQAPQSSLSGYKGPAIPATIVANPSVYADLRHLFGQDVAR